VYCLRREKGSIEPDGWSGVCGSAKKKRQRKEGVFMRKVVLVLAILVFAVPAMAGVTISVVDNGSLSGSIKYQCNDPNKIRAFALVIDVNGSDAQFQTISGYDPNYWVYPGSINIVGNEVAQQGTPIAAGGTGANTITIEMGSLYASNDPCHTVAPDVNGVLLSFTVDKGCCISLSEDSARAGVVMEDTDKTFGAGYVTLIPGCIAGPPSDPNVGTCWDPNECVAQPYGDATCDGAINLDDLIAMKKAWGTTPSGTIGTGIGEYNCCADFNRAGVSKDAINLDDLIRLKQNWGSPPAGTSTGNQTCPPGH
jgi:hypothetical protein